MIGKARTTQNRTEDLVVPNQSRYHLPRCPASCPAVKNKPTETLVGQKKTSPLALSQNQDRMLSWNPELHLQDLIRTDSSSKTWA